MKIAFRLVLLAALAALGCWLWAVFFPGPEKIILRKIAGLASTASLKAEESTVIRAVKVGDLIGYFTVDAEIIFETRTWSGRDEIRDTARAVFASLTMLNVEFLDTTVHLGADKQTATATCTARVNTGDKKDYGVQEMRFQLRKIGGDWLISRMETVKTLS